MRTTIALIFYSLFIFSCSNGSAPEKAISKTKNESMKYLGEWKSVDRIYPYNSGLKIELDNEFHFEYGACLSNGFSKGMWKLQNDTLVLSSTKVDSCLFLLDFGVDCFIIQNDSLVPSLNRPNPICKPKTDKEFIVFDFEEFIIENDTLKHIVRGQKRCPEIRNDFYRSVKDTIANTAYTK